MILLVPPTLAALPVDNADDATTLGPSEIEGVSDDALIGWCMTYLATYTGPPATAITAGCADGLPVGMQIIGPRLGGCDVLGASAAALEGLRPWPDRYARCRERPL